MDPVIASTPSAAAQLLESGSSLMQGWVPITVQVVTAMVLVAAIGSRSRGWRVVWLPIAALFGGVVAYGTRRACQTGHRG